MASHWALGNLGLLDLLLQHLWRGSCIQDTVTREDTCPGQQRQYRVCQSGTCPADTVPFRNVQCALYNYRPIPGTQERNHWVPFYGAPNACDLNCLAVGRNFYYNFGRVLDGTKCGLDTAGTCINGHCLSSGCDGILGSDACGKCGGGNDSCILIKRVFREPFPSAGFFGYKNVTSIPAGAMQIKVTDRSHNFLALMNSSRRYVINGDWSVSWPGVFKVAGTEVHYSRTADSHESLEAAGPTDEDLHILVLFQEQNPGIEYEFWLPKEIYHNVQEDSSALRQQQPREGNLDFWVHTTPPSNQKKNTSRASLGIPQRNEDPTTHRTGGCRKCKKLKGKSQRIKHYCQSDFVIRAKILGRRLLGKETRYDIQVKHAYKNQYPIVHREYIWVSNTCDCPLLQDRREYLMMATRHVNYEHTLNRILLSAESYVKPWSPREDHQLRDVNGLCATSP